MKPEEFSSKIAEIKGKVQKLVSLHRNLLEKNKQLAEENLLLKSSAIKQNQAINELNEKIKMLMLSKSVSKTDEETKQLKLKINSLLREVDKCLALVNN